MSNYNQEDHIFSLGGAKNKKYVENDSDDEDISDNENQNDDEIDNGKNTKKSDKKHKKKDDDSDSDYESSDDEKEDNVVPKNDDSDDDSDIGSEKDPDDDDQITSTSSRDTGKINRLPENYQLNIDDDEDDEEDEEDEFYLQKFDESLKHNIIAEYHPELLVNNYDEVDILTRIVRNEEGVIIDPFHRTLPFVTKYERARILGERAKQLNSGAKPFVEVDITVIDGYLIALEEFKQKKIPFIVKRPLPSGGCEYWKLRDLEIL